MSDFKSWEQLTHELYASIEKVADRDDLNWRNEGYKDVYTNNGLIFQIFFNKEQMKAVYIVGDFNFAFNKSTYMVYADSEFDSSQKAAILQGGLQSLIYWNYSSERYDLLDALQPSILRWKELKGYELGVDVKSESA